MTSEKKFFLQVISDHLNKQKTDPPEELDWEQVLQYAHSQQVEGIFFYQCKDHLSSAAGLESVYKQFNKAYAANTFYYANRAALLSKLTRAMNDEKIPFYIAKGIEVAHLYPVESLRTMGDTDITVHTEDRERVHKIFLDLGFKDMPREDIEWSYFKNNIEFELHDRLVYDKKINSKESKEFSARDWDNAVPVSDGYYYRLNWEYHIVFLFLHLKKHFITRGVGFRQFMDLAVVVDTQRDKMDWNEVRRSLESLDLMRFAATCLTLCERWFGIKSAFETVELDDAFYEDAADKIFKNGVFGFDDSANDENRTMNAIRNRGKNKKFAKLIVALRRIFPPYNAMRYVEHYSFVEGRPYLLPAAWIYRFYRAVRYGRLEHGAKSLKGSFVSDEKLLEREKMLEKWGL